MPPLTSTIRTIELPDGESTTLEQWGTSGPILLCVHGIASSRKSWQRTAERFAGTYRICAYDQRGHGDFAKIWGPMTLAQAEADCVAVAGALGEPVRALIGHSWGGAVVLLAGRSIPTGGVVAVDPMIHQPRNRWYEDFVKDLEPLLGPPVEQREALVRAAFAGLPPVEIEAKVHALRGMSLRPVMRLGEQNRADFGLWDLRNELRRYPVPVFLMMADPAESVVEAADLALIAETLGPLGAIEIFDGADHTLHRTAFDRFAASLEAFLG
jgi:pimeloyl-ACP methyl ester carboxylesterase